MQLFVIRKTTIGEGHKIFLMKHLLSAFFLTLISGFALADFVGMEYEAVAETANGTTYRVYATFDNPTDELVAVYALEEAPMVVGVSTSFFQDAVGAVLAQTINPAFFGAFPSLQYDSWFTIGSEDSNGTSEVQQVGMDTYFASFEAGGGFTVNSFVGGSWFLLPNQSPDAEAGADGRVLIGQFTTDGVVNLTMNFQWDDEATNTFNSEGISIVFPDVPCLDAPTRADNYNAIANEDDGSALWWRPLHRFVLRRGVRRPSRNRRSTYRIYANFSSNDVEVTPCTAQIPSHGFWMEMQRFTKTRLAATLEDRSILCSLVHFQISSTTRGGPLGQNRETPMG